jgi:hypothetical protein
MHAGHVDTLASAAGFCKQGERVFSFELQSGCRSFFCGTREEICQKIRDTPSEAHWHECLSVPGLVQAVDPYIDIDIDATEGMGAQEAAVVLANVVGGMERVLAGVGGEFVVSVYSSCGEGKHSWHVVGRHESAMCRDTRIAWMMAMVVMETAGGEVGNWFGGVRKGKGRQCFVDMGVYTHGFLRTAWSTKRNSKRVKVPVGAQKEAVGAADEVHLVGKPDSFGGAFWSESDVSQMCKVMGFEYEFALVKWEQIWKRETGQKLPHTRKPTTGLKVCGVAPTGDLPVGAAELLEGLVDVLGSRFQPAAPAGWATAQARTRVLRFRTASRYCPFAHRCHSSNNVYVNVHLDAVPVTYKIFCMSAACTEAVAATTHSVIPQVLALAYYESKMSPKQDVKAK